MDEQTEQLLVAGLKRGEESAFDRVFEHFRPRLFGFLVRMIGRRDAAEDLLQETWVRLATHAGRFREDTQLGAWLFAVARNLCYSHLRSRLLDAERVGELAQVSCTGTQAKSPFEEVAAAELERRLERALARLSHRDREVLLLVAVEGLSPTSAAAVCGVTPEALRQRLARARARLADSLQDAQRPAPRAKKRGE